MVIDTLIPCPHLPGCTPKLPIEGIEGISKHSSVSLSVRVRW